MARKCLLFLEEISIKNKFFQNKFVRKSEFTGCVRREDIYGIENGRTDEKIWQKDSRE